MDVTILSANASQLKVILKEPESDYYTLLLVLISISMILQVFTAYLSFYDLRNRPYITSAKGLGWWAYKMQI